MWTKIPFFPLENDRLSSHGMYQVTKVYAHSGKKAEHASNNEIDVGWSGVI